MSYIFGDLKTKLQTQVGDANLSSSVAGDALNYTQQSIFNTFDMTLNSASASATVAKGNNTFSTTLPSDFQRFVNIRITSPTAQAGSLKEYYMTPETFRETYPVVTQSGPLSTWTYWTSIEFSTKADQAYTITYDYIKTVTQMSNASDIPTIPEAFEELLILGAKIRIYEQKEDFDYASQYANRYADLLEAFTTRYSTRQVDYRANVPGSRVRV
jgi:hypothetical protein